LKKKVLSRKDNIAYPSSDDNLRCVIDWLRVRFPLCVLLQDFARLKCEWVHFQIYSKFCCSG